jgi:hypothetical protein
MRIILFRDMARRTLASCGVFNMTLLMRGRSDDLIDRYSERNRRTLKTIDHHVVKV